MIRTNFLQCIILIQCFLLFTNCHGMHDSLIVTEVNGVLTLTKPEITKSHERRFNIPSTGKIYNLCPKPDKSKNKKKNHTQDNTSDDEKIDERALIPVKQNGKNEAIIDKDICEKQIKTVLAQIIDPENFKASWRRKLELYHSGFLVNRKDLAEHTLLERLRNKMPLRTKPTTSDEYSKQKYYQLSNDFDVILGIEIHFHKKLKQTIAVEYTLPSMDVNEFSKLGNLQFEKEFLKEIEPSFENYIEADNDKKFIESIVGTSWEDYFHQKRTQNMIRAIPLAPPQHFPIPTWKLPTMIWPNQIPVWNHVISQWNEVIKFSQIVAQFIGDLKVSIGTSEIMFLPDSRERLKEIIPEITVESMHNMSEPYHARRPTADERKIIKNVNEANSYIPQVLLTDKTTKFRMWNFLWATFEYKNEANHYGIFVIMHLNPFVDNTKEICDDICIANGWHISNSNFEKGKTYCCEMTPNIIEKLKAYFLSIKNDQRQIFNLNKWSEKRTEILDAYNAVKFS